MRRNRVVPSLRSVPSAALSMQGPGAAPGEEAVTRCRCGRECSGALRCSEGHAVCVACEMTWCRTCADDKAEAEYEDRYYPPLRRRGKA